MDERQSVHLTGEPLAQPAHASQIHTHLRLDPPRHRHRFPERSKVGVGTPPTSRRPNLGHGEAKPLQSLSSSLISSPERNGVERYTGRAVRAKCDDHIAASTVETLIVMMWILGPEPLVVEEPEPTSVGVDARVDLVHELLVSEHAAYLRSPSGHERHRGKSVTCG